MRVLLPLVLLVAWLGSAHAHDLITAELAKGYLDKAARWQEQSTGAAQKAERAMAQLQIGVMLDEIRGYLNRDLAVHGEVQGLASNYLVAELARGGTPLSYDQERRFFTANSRYYRAALDLGLSGAPARQARLGLLRGEFYDSFDIDPLQTSQSGQQLQAQLRLVDTLYDSVDDEPDREEVRFIAAIVYARAAKSTTDRQQRTTYHEQALAYVEAFAREYPDSMRSAAMPVVRDALNASQ